MPAPLAVDWDRAKAVYVKGLSLAEIARQTGCSYVALRSRAWRRRWSDDAGASLSAP